MHHFLRTPTFLVLVLFPTLGGCGDDGGGNDLPDASPENDGSTGDGGAMDAGTDASTSIEPTYANVAQILGTSCTFGTSCHGGAGAGRGALNFQAAEDFREVLVDVPACGNNAMARVAPGQPDESWLVVKIGAHSSIGWDDEGMIALEGTPPADDRPGCPTPDGFGRLMPENRGGITLLSEERRAAIREWVELGAPGPND